MKIFTDRQLVEIENTVLDKIYAALKELHELDNSDASGAVRDRHNELLDLALKHLQKSPTKQHVYSWIKCPVNFSKYLLG